MRSIGLSILTLLSLNSPLHANDELPIGKDLESASAHFLGARFIDSALGEGAHAYDQDPLFRTDAFDCTTFVETVWAIALSDDSYSWRRELQRIRYGAKSPSFIHRLHFISLDWLPTHIKDLSLSDISEAIEPKLTRTKTLIDKKAWYQRKHLREWPTFNREYPKENAKEVILDYIDINEFLHDTGAQERLRIELLKAPLIINFVRPNWDTVLYIGTRIDISHQGFVIWKNGNFVLRHASAANGFVKDEDFLQYLSFYRHHQTLKGIQFIRINSLPFLTTP